MKDSEQRKAAREFVRDWTGRGDEKQETQSFWRALLGKVYGLEEPEKWLSFELPVQLSHTSFIDAYIEKTGVLIEQKGKDIDLTKGYKQSDGSFMTPYRQARRYAGYLPHNKNPRWIVVSNFKEFHIYDNNRPNSDPEIVQRPGDRAPQGPGKGIPPAGLFGGHRRREHPEGDAALHPGRRAGGQALRRLFEAL